MLCKCIPDSKLHDLLKNLPSKNSKQIPKESFYNLRKAETLSSRDPFIQHLLATAVTHRTEVKWVFVPYPGLKWTLGERLLHLGQPWANFRFTTPFELALETAAPDLIAEGVNPKPESLGPSLIHKLLLEIPDQVPNYYRQLLGQPGLTEALWSAVQTLRMAGLTSHDLEVLPAPKRQEIQALMQAYESYLYQNLLADRATVLQRANPRALVQEEDLVILFPTARWHALERALLDSVGGVTPSSDPEPATVLRFFRSGRRDAEIVEILRRIRNLPVDQVELATPDSSAIPLLRDKLALVGIPSTFETGLPIGVSRPGQALLGLLSWIEHGFSAFDLRSLLLAGLIHPGSARLDPIQAARFLERSQATWGRLTYAAKLSSFRSWLLQRASASEDDAALHESLLYQARKLQELQTWVSDLLERFPETLDWGSWIRGLRKTLLEDVPATAPVDQAARRRLERSLQELHLLDGRSWSQEETLRLLRDRLRPLEFGSSRALPGHLHVTELERIGRSGRSHIFLFGLEEGRLQPPAEDPILSDKERQTLRLPLSTDREDWTRSLARADATVTLSYSTRDMRTGQEQVPTWLYFQWARQETPLESFADLTTWLGEPLVYAPADPANSVSESEWWLAWGPFGEKRALQFFPNLASGAEAVRERRSARFTRFDGRVPQAAHKLDPMRALEPTSASKMEMLAGCPFRYFLEQGLQIRPRDSERPDLNRWLDEAARGRLLHNLFALYHRHLRRESLRPEFERDRIWLLDLLSSSLRELRESQPANSEALAESETVGLERDLERFLRLELLEPDRTPLALEFGFGMSDEEGEELSCPEPVMIDLGEEARLLLRGRIDRLDRVPDGLEVVDYKTGRRLSTPVGAVYRGGRQLQHALYSLVAEQLAGHLGPICRSSYYFPSAHAQEHRVTLEFPDKARLRGLLLDLTEPARTGAFVHSERKEEDCRYCLLKSACRSDSEQPDKAMYEAAELAFRKRCWEIA